MKKIVCQCQRSTLVRLMLPCTYITLKVQRLEGVVSSS